MDRTVMSIAFLGVVVLTAGTFLYVYKRQRNDLALKDKEFLAEKATNARLIVILGRLLFRRSFNPQNKKPPAIDKAPSEPVEPVDPSDADKTQSEDIRVTRAEDTAESERKP